MQDTSGEATSTTRKGVNVRDKSSTIDAFEFQTTDLNCKYNYITGSGTTDHWGWGRMGARR